MPSKKKQKPQSLTAQDKLWEAHEREAKKRHATFHNFGWGEEEGSIASKTDKGILTTTLQDSGKYEHEWGRLTRLFL